MNGNFVKVWLKKDSVENLLDKKILRILSMNSTEIYQEINVIFLKHAIDFIWNSN